MRPGSCGAFIAGCSGLTLTDDERAFFTDSRPFGFILFARNIDTADQIRALCADLRAALGYDAPIFIDQEGGRVQRLRPPLAQEWRAPLDEVAHAGPLAAQIMRLRYRLIAAELRALGIDGNCAPCVDIARPHTHEILHNRCYGTDADTVARLGRAVAEGLITGGVVPVLKHIPGHGAADLDSHLELPHVALPLDQLTEQDFAPFRALAELPFAMTAHIVYDAIDADAPATTSPAMIELIRDQIGFKGVLMSDDISMQALAGGIGQRSAAAMAAGCDLVLHCNGDMPEMIEVAKAAGTISEKAARAAAAGLALRANPAEDTAMLSDEWATMMAALDR
ncbi:beta-N-acetylhexosaminidase [Actibacterium sp. XHP0104]|uniref:beta-N-acetylhexosaminidase n=1 Tax=Actibacterium sp. XHP0104 TaxID=2984335 RepID=UPI0021E8A571|nr:beta-N-acetylhexosaminidase [Actibacterium sp. XHP0104]MCV2881210.1 beta-N-acetylhexosaminidase [Actibacterium sp. XHP0104]